MSLYSLLLLAYTLLLCVLWGYTLLICVLWGYTQWVCAVQGDVVQMYTLLDVALLVDALQSYIEPAYALLAGFEYTSDSDESAPNNREPTARTTEKA